MRVTSRVKRNSQAIIGEEEGGFRKGRGFVNHIFELRQVAEKVLKKTEGVCNVYVHRNGI